MCGGEKAIMEYNNEFSRTGGEAIGIIFGTKILENSTHSRQTAKQPGGHSRAIDRKPDKGPRHQHFQARIPSENNTMDTRNPYERVQDSHSNIHLSGAVVGHMLATLDYDVEII